MVLNWIARIKQLVNWSLFLRKTVHFECPVLNSIVTDANTLVMWLCGLYDLSYLSVKINITLQP